MRFVIPSLGAALVACATLAACTPATTPEQKPPQAVVKPLEKPRSPHHVMVSLAGGEPMARDQQDYVISLQDKIAERWQPVPDRIKYNVGLEFTLTRQGLITDNVKAVSSMSSRKTIESCSDAILRADRFGVLPPQFKTAPQTFLCEFLYSPQDSAAATAASASATAASRTATSTANGTAATTAGTGTTAESHK